MVMEETDSTATEGSHQEDPPSASQYQSSTPTNGTDNNKVSDEEVQNLIAVARSLGAISLDLSKKGLREIPPSMLELDHVEVSISDMIMRMMSWMLEICDPSHQN